MNNLAGWRFVSVDPDSDYLRAFVEGFVEFALDLTPYPDLGRVAEAGSLSDHGFSFEDLAADTLFDCMKDCAEFLGDVGDVLDRVHVSAGYTAREAGEDFARARNSDDLGFLERLVLPDQVALFLQDAAGRWGETTFLVVEDACGGRQVWS
jgi:hypothetical protein